MADVKIRIIGEDQLSNVFKTADAKLAGFRASLEHSAGVNKNFGSTLLDMGKQAGLSQEKLRWMAESSGLFSKKQLEAADAASKFSAGTAKIAAQLKSGQITSDAAGKAFGNLARELDAANRKSMSFGEQIMAMKGQLLVAAGAIGGFAMAAKAAFDLGAEGAAINQTADSFDLLMEKVGAAPNMLDQLRKASNGTIPDMQLMSSTATLLAGATGELATDMANAAPQILEIAKAANKLNPTLGDTTYMYQSLMTGIKRGSPMLIDNTGLVLKIGEANKKYADQLGKSVEALTADEQKQALLNATLEAGRNLIDQVGGSTESQTDAYKQLETATKNLTDQFKSGLAPAITDIVKGLLLIIETNDKVINSVKKEIDLTNISAKSKEDYYQSVKGILEAHDYFVKDTENGIQVFRREGQVFRDVTKEFDNLKYAYLENSAGLDEGTKAYLRWIAGTRAAGSAVDDFAARLKNAQKAANDTKVSYGEFGITILEGAEANKWGAMYAKQNADTHLTLKEAIDKTNEMEKENLETLKKLRDAEKARLADQILSVSIAGQLASINKDYHQSLADLRDTNQELVDEYKQITAGQGSYAEAISKTIDKNRELTLEYDRMLASGTATEEQLADIRQQIAENSQEQEKATRAAGDRLGEINRAIDENNQKMREATELMKKQTAELIYQQAAQGLGSDAALVLARGLGLISEVDYKLILQIQELRAQFKGFDDGILTASEGAAEYTKKIIELYNATVKLNEETIKATSLTGQLSGAMGGSASGVGAGMIDLGGGVYQYTAPGSTSPTAATGGYIGNGIYVGGPGQVVGPGAPGAAVNLNYTNNGVTLENASELQRLLTPIVNNIIAGR